MVQVSEFPAYTHITTAALTFGEAGETVVVKVFVTVVVLVMVETNVVVRPVMTVAMLVMVETSVVVCSAVTVLTEMLVPTRVTVRVVDGLVAEYRP